VALNFLAVDAIGAANAGPQSVPSQAEAIPRPRAMLAASAFRFSFVSSRPPARSLMNGVEAVRLPALVTGRVLLKGK